MNKLLLVIPENSYKSNDFVLTAERLGIDFLVITAGEKVSGQFGAPVIFQIFSENLNFFVSCKNLGLQVSFSIRKYFRI